MPPRRLSNTFLSRTTTTSSSSSASTNSTHSATSSFLSDPDPEELDCFRSMRGKPCDDPTTLQNEISKDISDLSNRLNDVRLNHEKEKKIFDSDGQGWSILVTRDDVRLCHVDEKGHYHFNHFPSNTNSPTKTGSPDRTSSVSPNRHKARNTGKEPLRVIDNASGRSLVEITPNLITVHHQGGTWQCRRFLGKVHDANGGVATKVSNIWQHRRRRRSQRFDEGFISGSESDEGVSSCGSNDTHEQSTDEALLCANTPGERGDHPRAYKSFYHDL